MVQFTYTPSQTIASYNIPKNKMHLVGGPTDHIIYDAQDGNIFYQYDTETDTFLLLNLPMFMRNAPDAIKTETVNWVRQCIQADKEGKVRPKSKVIREYLDDPKTIRIRAQMKRGYVNLEDFA